MRASARYSCEGVKYCGGALNFEAVQQLLIINVILTHRAGNFNHYRLNRGIRPRERCVLWASVAIKIAGIQLGAYLHLMTKMRRAV